MRTQESTVQIKGLILKIQDGTELAADTVQANAAAAHRSAETIASSEKNLQYMMQSFGFILNENTVITASIHEQTLASADVSMAIHRIQNLAVKTANAAEQASARAGEMSQCATQLSRLIGQFTV